MLIKHVLSSMPLHLLSAVPVPKKVIEKIEVLMADFLWGEK